MFWGWMGLNIRQIGQGTADFLPVFMQGEMPQFMPDAEILAPVLPDFFVINDGRHAGLDKKSGFKVIAQIVAMNLDSQLGRDRTAIDGEHRFRWARGAPGIVELHGRLERFHGENYSSSFKASRMRASCFLVSGFNCR